MKTAHKKICRRVPQTRLQDRCGGEGLGASFTLSHTQSRTHNQQRKHCMNAFFFFKIRPRSSTPLKLSSLFSVSQLFAKPNDRSTVLFTKCWRKKERGVSPSRVPFFFTLITFKRLLPWDLTKSTKLSVWACYLPEVFSLSPVVDQQIKRHQRWDWCKKLLTWGTGT